MTVAPSGGPPRLFLVDGFALVIPPCILLPADRFNVASSMARGLASVSSAA